MPERLYDELAEDLRLHFRGTLEPWEFVGALGDELFFDHMSWLDVAQCVFVMWSESRYDGFDVPASVGLGMVERAMRMHDRGAAPFVDCDELRGVLLDGDGLVNVSSVCSLAG